MSGGPPVGEGLNPTRRYKSFRPRQAFRWGSATGAGGAGNFTTVQLFNDSIGDQYVVVRNFVVETSASAVVRFAYGPQLTLGTTSNGVAILSGESKRAGVLTYGSQAAQITADYFVSVLANSPYTYPSTFPFAVLQPQVGLDIQLGTANQGLTWGIIWEAIFADELDYFW